jgi:hypothetical protein
MLESVSMMRWQLELEFFVLRDVPDVVYGRFINIGIVMTALGEVDFGAARFLNDWTAVSRFDPNADLDFLREFARDRKEWIAEREKREQMLEQIKASFSNSIQLSTPQTCVCDDPLAELERLSLQYLMVAGHSL